MKRKNCKERWIDAVNTYNLQQWSPLIDMLCRGEKYFQWEELTALVSWLRYKGCCAYCECDLFSSPQSLKLVAHTDHLIPRSSVKDVSQYTLIEWHPLNVVPCCGWCNNCKRGWNPNTKVKPTIYLPNSHKGQLTLDQHNELVKRCREYLKPKRDEWTQRFPTIQQLWRDALNALPVTQAKP